MAMTLKALRVNVDMDQKSAAKALGITPETLGSWEQGKTFPNVKQITLIEKLYNTSYNDVNFLLENVD